MGFREVVRGWVSPTPFTESCDRSQSENEGATERPVITTAGGEGGGARVVRPQTEIP